jgi:hypothetical protein
VSLSPFNWLSSCAVCCDYLSQNLDNLLKSEDLVLSGRAEFCETVGQCCHSPYSSRLLPPPPPFLGGRDESPLTDDQCTFGARVKYDILIALPFAPQDRLLQIIEICRKAWVAKAVSLREVSTILGNLAQVIQAIPFPHGHYQCIQRHFFRESARADRDLSALIFLDRESNFYLDWWASNVESANGTPLST